jgi:quinol monooxygenase YgiN
MTTIVNAVWTALDGHEGTVREFLTSLQEASQAEPGVIAYQAYFTDDEPATFHIFEHYADDDAFQAHLDSPHFTEYGTLGAIPHLAHRARTVYRAL